MRGGCCGDMFWRSVVGLLAACMTIVGGFFWLAQVYVLLREVLLGPQPALQASRSATYERCREGEADSSSQ
jgi:hypothetical protein